MAMRLHALLSMSLLSCSYEFGGAADLSSGGAGATTSGLGGGAATTGVTSSPASGSVSSPTATTITAASSVAASSSTGTLPEIIPPCGGFTDDFAGGIDPVRWEIRGNVSPHDGHVDLSPDVYTAALDLMVSPVAPCAFEIRRDSDDDVSITVRDVAETESLGLSFRASGDETWIRRNFQDESIVLSGGGERADAFAIVVLETQIVLLARLDGEQTWTQILLEDAPPWLPTARASIFSQASWTTTRIDDYGVIPVALTDLALGAAPPGPPAQ